MSILIKNIYYRNGYRAATLMKEFLTKLEKVPRETGNFTQ